MVVGGGTVGAWCAYFLAQAGLDRVVLVDKGTLGSGASSRAAGVVRMQGGTPEAVRLGRWSRDFYRRQHDELGTDSGFVQQGYLLPCFTEAEVAAARERMAMQTGLGLPVRWLDPGQVDELNPTLAPGQTLGGTFCAEDGYITPPRNVTAYTVALVPQRCPGLRARELRRAAQDGPGRAGDRGADQRGPGPDRDWWCSPAGRSWPRWAAGPGSGSRPAASATRSR